MLTKALPPTGTLENPIIVNGAGDEQYAGCTGYPADSHQVNWLTVRAPSSLSNPYEGIRN